MSHHRYFFQLIRVGRRRCTKYLLTFDLLRWKKLWCDIPKCQFHWCLWMKGGWRGYSVPETGRSADRSQVCVVARVRRAKVEFSSLWRHYSHSASASLYTTWKHYTWMEFFPPQPLKTNSLEYPGIPRLMLGKWQDFLGSLSYICNNEHVLGFVKGHLDLQTCLVNMFLQC